MLPRHPSRPRSFIASGARAKARRTSSSPEATPLKPISCRRCWSRRKPSRTKPAETSSDGELSFPLHASVGDRAGRLRVRGWGARRHSPYGSQPIEGPTGNPEPPQRDAVLNSRFVALRPSGNDAEASRPDAWSGKDHEPFLRQRQAGCGNASPPARLPLPELEPLDLAGRGLGQFGDELDGARVFVGGEAVLDETLQLGLVC